LNLLPLLILVHDKEKNVNMAYNFAYLNKYFEQTD
jgi:hypothetical protein